MVPERPKHTSDIMNAENPAITHAKIRTIRRIPTPAKIPAAFLASGVGFTLDVVDVVDVTGGVGVADDEVEGVVDVVVAGGVDVGAEGGVTVLSSYFSNGANIYILFRQIIQTKYKLKRCIKHN